jgi:non-ribosomal peptide synthetase component E (peptide arylation enzyme)
MSATTPDPASEEYVRRGWWRDDTLWSCFARNAQATPRRLALLDPPNRAAFTAGAPRSLDYGALREAVERLARQLAGQGLVAGDIVLAQLPNVAESIVMLLACARLRCIFSPVATQLRAHELRHLLGKARPKLAVTFGTIDGFDHAALWLELCGEFPGTRLAAWGAGAGVPDLAALRDDAPLPEAEPGADTPLTLCWTSGTEGNMKGVVRDHRRWLCFDDAVTDIAGLPPGATLLNPFPVANMAAYVGFVLPWLKTGGTLVMHHPYSLPVFAAQLGAGNVDFTATPPALLNLILQREEIAGQLDLRSLRAIGSGGGPLAAATMAGFKQRYGIDILNLFGSSEGGSLISGPGDIPSPETRATCFPRWGAGGLRWASRLAQRVQTRLVDVPSGADIVTAGRPGELRFRGPGVFSGYFDDAEATARAFDEQGFYRSGDLFEIAGDEGRYYRFVGRLKNLVIRGGTNIAPEEVENLLADHPGVAEVAVVGYPDDVMGEKLCAFVVVRGESPPDLESLRRFLLEEKRVARYKVPERLVLLARLPRNAMGKLVHHELRRSVCEAPA